MPTWMCILHILKLYSLYIIDELLLSTYYNFKERVDKWTHEPRSNFNHKKHIYIAFILIYICCTILIQKYKKK
jgi:hypothetical protein